MRLSCRARIVLLAAAVVTGAAACGSSGSSADPSPKPQVSPAAEPQVAPAPATTPVGTVLAVGDTPEGVVVDATHGLVIAALRSPDALAFVGLAAPHRIRIVDVPGRARHLRLLQPGGPLLLPAEDTDTLLEVALPAGTVAVRHTTLKQPHDAVSVAGRLWVTDELAESVSAIEPGAGGKSTVLPAGVQPGGIAAAGDRVAAADVRGNQLFVYDAPTVKQVAVLPAGDGPTHIVQTGPTTVAVADTRGNAILLYDLSGPPRLLQRLPLEGGPYGMAADLVRHRLWVALSGRNRLVALNVGTDRLTATGISYPTVQQPNSLDVVPATGAPIVAGAVRAGVLQFLPAD